MDDVKKIAYCLTAAGGVISARGFHLLYSDSGDELVEELWDATSLKQDDAEERSVGENIKPNAPAAYIWAAPATEGELDEVCGTAQCRPSLYLPCSSANLLRCHDSVTSFRFTRTAVWYALPGMKSSGSGRVQTSGRPPLPRPTLRPGSLEMSGWMALPCSSSTRPASCRLF